jgi:hypothetical protein
MTSNVTIDPSVTDGPGITDDPGVSTWISVTAGATPGNLLFMSPPGFLLLMTGGSLLLV